MALLNACITFPPKRWSLASKVTAMTARLSDGLSTKAWSAGVSLPSPRSATSRAIACRIGLAESQRMWKLTLVA
jgi:hypothetical protein